MKVNLTLVIQIINFLVTYLFLNRFVFRPALAIIESRKKDEDQLKEAINKEEQLLLQKQKEHRQHLVYFQKRIRQQFPKPTAVSAKSTAHIRYTRDENTIKRLVEKTKNLLIEEMPRVR